MNFFHFSIFAIGVLVAGNIILGYLFFREKKKQATKPQIKLDKSATDLLAELMGGGAVIVTGVLNKEELFLWSPKSNNRSV